jgi:SAM-dependent methyltransferase
MRSSINDCFFEAAAAKWRRNLILMETDMLNIPADDSRAIAVISAIHSGAIDGLERLLSDTPGLATARIIDAQGVARTLLHIATDWPGHFPNVAKTIAALVAAGAEVNAKIPHLSPQECEETPLHWAASSDDVAALDALLDCGADIEASGAVFTGGAPMSDAVIFANWKAARRLLERGARTTIWQAAALGLLDPVEEYCERQPPPSPDEITSAFWHACRGGQKQTAEYLLGRGAELNWIGYDEKTPLQVADESGAKDLGSWLRSQGARLTEEIETVPANSTDRSNGYEAISGEFISGRTKSSIGAATVRQWAKGLPPGGDVLDLGCGHGAPISEALIDEGLNLYGVDASPSMIAAFRARFPHAQAEINAVEDSRFFGRGFDGVVAWGLIFLLAPEAQANLIHKVAAALKSGGRFMFTAPYQVCEWSDIQTGQKSVSLGADAYRQIVEEAGLILDDEAEDEGQNHYYFTRKLDKSEG